MTGAGKILWHCEKAWVTAGVWRLRHCQPPASPVMEKWLVSNDPDVLWIMNENLKKNRLIKMDVAWVEHCRSLIGSVAVAGARALVV